MKTIIALAACGLAVLISGTAEARENRPLKCRIGAARAAPAYDGPALVANVPRAMTPVSLNAVQMTDRGVWKNVVVEGLFARRTEMQTLEVMSRLVNCSKDPITIQARASFMDESQYPTEPSSIWKTIHIAPLSMSTYEERSISNKVGSYLVELRSPQ